MFAPAIFAGAGRLPDHVNFPAPLLFFSWLLFATAGFGGLPNILFLLSDDQNWDGTSVQLHPELPASKSRYYQTPNLEQLAKQGMRFSAAYAPSPSCSPTRISLQTGQNPAQLRWTKAAPPVTEADGFRMVGPVVRKAIRSDEITIGEVLREAGYTTAHFGKWHLGSGGPAAHGYDASDGETGNRDAEPFVDPNPVDIFGMGERALALMKSAQAEEKPFFIQMSYHALHYPENARAATVAKFTAATPGGRPANKDRRAITWDLDDGVGRLVRGVDALGLKESTYVIYMSDNGSGGKRGVLQGGKGSAMEAGIRVPMIVRGPGIKPDSHCATTVVGTDWFPTFAGWAAGDTEPKLPPDIVGGDLHPLLQGTENSVKRPHLPLFHVPHYQGDVPRSALLDGQWKLLRNWETKEDALYDLSRDPGEQRNVAAIEPDRLRAMSVELDRLLAYYKAQIPTPNPRFDPANVPDLKAGNKRKPAKGNPRRDPRRKKQRSIEP